MNIIEIPVAIFETVHRHFFQNELEQGAFLFARAEPVSNGMHLVVEGHYLVPPSGWEHQLDVYLQMRDSERAKIMRMARARGACAIDCHSHPHSGKKVWFSPSDVHGITEFSQYAKWKLDGRPFAALVWGEQSIDAVVWHGDYSQPQTVDEVHILGAGLGSLRPANSWFQRPRAKHRFDFNE